MGRIVVIEKNEAGKVELTKEELQKMLDDAYNQGYADGNRSTTVTYPYWPYTVLTNDPCSISSKDYVTITCQS